MRLTWGMADSNVIETKTQRTALEDSGIFRCTCIKGSEHGINDAIENIKAALTIGGKKRRPTLVDMRPVKSVNREARAYYAGPACAEVHGPLALLVDSPVSKMLGNFFIGFSKPLVPTRLFTSEDEALKWLKEALQSVK